MNLYNRSNKSVSSYSIDKKTFPGNFVQNRKSAQPLTLVKIVKNEILNALPDADLSRLKPYLESVVLMGEENIYQPEEKIRYVYFLENAVVSQFCILEDGRTVEVSMVGKEGFTGHSTLFGAENSCYWSQVSIGGTAERINIDILKQEFGESAALQQQVFKFLNSHTAQISKRVVCNNYHTVEERFCNWLLMMYNRHGNSKLQLTHSQIANYLGVHRPSFTHIAKKLRDENVITYCRGKLSILDQYQLQNHACECFQDDEVIF